MVTTSSKTILAFDPGYDRLGWAVGKVEGRSLKILSFGCITTAAKETLHNRFTNLIQEVETLCIKYSPEELALETLFFSKNQTTAMAVSEVRGLLKTIGIQHGMKLFEYQPSQIKNAVTGNGHADKAAVKKMITLQLKITVTPKTLDDTLDALAVLLTHSVIVK